MTPAAALAKRLLPLLGLLVAGVACQPMPAKDPDALRSQLAAHRELQIQRLHEYAEAGVFPRNLTTPGGVHMFRDAEGRHCAVANLVHQDGRDDLVAATVRDRNDLLMKDVHDGAMKDWILTSGLTQEELARIQIIVIRSHQHDMPRVAPRPSPVQEIAVLQDPLRPTPHHVASEALDEGGVRARLRTYLAGVEAELRANTEASLALAAARASGADEAVD